MSNRTLFEKAKSATYELSTLDENRKNKLLSDLADSIIQHKSRLLEANASDLQRMDKANPLYDRLLLNGKRLEAIAQDIRHVAELPSPLGHISSARILCNGLRIRRVSVPYGVVGIIYEARPNVSFDVFSLCFKSGNVCLLKGGRDADCSNRAIVDLIHRVLEEHGLSHDIVTLLPATHEATAELLSAVGYVDVCIPRGGKQLISFVRQTAKVPVIETGAGVVHAYFDKAGNLEMGRRIVENAKTRRVSVCNALDCLIVHSQRLPDLPYLIAPLVAHGVRMNADRRAFEAIREGNSAANVELVDEKDASVTYATEYMDYVMSVKTVDTVGEALSHIACYGSGHSECIITEDEPTARIFQSQVDAACVYWNAPTSFTDGAQFGLGAEIGISTQKLGPRGPMGLEELTTYKWIIEGEGQVRD